MKAIDGKDIDKMSERELRPALKKVILELKGTKEQSEYWLDCYQEAASDAYHIWFKHNQAAPPAAALNDVIQERLRQVDKEGFDRQHDDEHTNGEIAEAAGCYALSAAGFHWVNAHGLPDIWPFGWSPSWWKPTTARRDLVKAAALCIAEIERLDRRPPAVTLEVQDLTLNTGRDVSPIQDKAEALKAAIAGAGDSRELRLARMKIDVALGWINEHVKNEK